MLTKKKSALFFVWREWNMIDTTLSKERSEMMGTTLNHTVLKQIFIETLIEGRYKFIKKKRDTEKSVSLIGLIHSQINEC